MEFGAFESTEILNPIYTRIKELGLESNVGIDTYGFTVIPPEKVQLGLSRTYAGDRVTYRARTNGQ